MSGIWHIKHQALLIILDNNMYIVASHWQYIYIQVSSDVVTLIHTPTGFTSSGKSLCSSMDRQMAGICKNQKGANCKVPSETSHLQESCGTSMKPQVSADSQHSPFSFRTRYCCQKALLQRLQPTFIPHAEWITK